MKKVSVIIPTYNRGEFLQKAIESIVHQEYPALEVIVVDDGSTDHTEAVVESLIATYPFIMYCKNSRAKGPSGARNTGIMKASGDYLAFLDSDDVWLEGHLADALEILEVNHHLDVFFGNHRAVDYSTGKPLYNFFDQKTILPSLRSIRIAPGINLLQDNLFIALLQEGFFSLGTSVIKKSVFNTVLLNESLTYAEDRDFAIRLYKEVHASFAYRETPAYISYRHDSNLTKSDDVEKMKKGREDRIELFKEYLSTYQLSGSERQLVMRLISEEFLNLAYLYRKQKEFRQAFTCILDSARFKFSMKQIVELMKIFVGQL